MRIAKPTPEVKALLDLATDGKLNIKYRKDTWVITAPGSDEPPVFITANVRQVSNLNNVRARIRRLVRAITPDAEPDATPEAPEAFDVPANWSTADLLAYAQTQSITVQANPGGLRITAPANGHAQALAAVLRTHETAVINTLAGDTMATTVHAATPTFLSDAYAVWSCMVDDAKDQGGEDIPWNTTPGILWAGARDNLMRQVGAEWSDSYRAALGNLLTASGATRCKLVGRAPIWWVNNVWPADDALAVRNKALPTGTPTPLDEASKGAATAPAEAAEPVDFSDPMQALTRIKARIDAAEERAAAETARADAEAERADAEAARANGEAKRADNAAVRATHAEQVAENLAADLGKAETRIEELEADNRDLADQLDTVTPKLAELDQIKTMFRTLGGAQ